MHLSISLQQDTNWVETNKKKKREKKGYIFHALCWCVSLTRTLTSHIWYLVCAIVVIILLSYILLPSALFSTHPASLSLISTECLSIYIDLLSISPQDKALSSSHLCRPANSHRQSSGSSKESHLKEISDTHTVRYNSSLFSLSSTTAMFKLKQPAGYFRGVL